MAFSMLIPFQSVDYCIYHIVANLLRKECKCLKNQEKRIRS